MLQEVEILKNLIGIPSQIGINNEKKIAEYLIDFLRSYGFDVKIYEFQKDRPNIIATYKFEKDGPVIILNGHMDTVPYFLGSDEWKHDPSVATEEDGKIYGRGACDMKGGIACALSAAAKCINNKTGKGTIVLSLVCDEENTSLYGTIPICENKLMSGDFAIILEPTECIVCPGQYGNMFFETRITSNGGHTGLPKDKHNCFDIGILYIDKLKKWAESKRKSLCDLQPFINIGRFEGGTSSGTIPGECILYWGTRVLPEDNFSDYFSEIFKLTEEWNKEIPALCSIETKLFEGGGIDSFSSDSIYVNKLADITGKSKGIFPASSDAGFICNDLLIDSVVFGPGSILQAHKSNEFVKIEELKECAEVLYEFLINL